MDGLAIAHRALGVIKFAAKIDGAKTTALGMARGVGDGTLRSEPPIIRMVLGVADGGYRAHATHQASRGVQLINTLHDILGQARAAR